MISTKGSQLEEKKENRIRKNAFGSVPPRISEDVWKLDLKKYSHLLPNMPRKRVYHDSLAYLDVVNKAKHKFNKKHQSDFLKNFRKDEVQYYSKRDELGFAINQDEWGAFL